MDHFLQRVFFILKTQPVIQASSASATALGFCSAILNKARAGPSGLRRPCSQFWSVATLTPIIKANSLWDFFNRLRIARTSAGLMFLILVGFRDPRFMRPACLML